MELLLSTSFVAAFVAGIAALFAPCCITVLLPSYFASIFRERYRVFLMTFIFFLGILIVFLPLGLTGGALGQILNRYHDPIFIGGGLFFVILGLLQLSGKHFSLPLTVNPTLKKHNAFSVFVLGIFSAIATTCCAPVLAGVLALSVLPGSIFWGGIYTVAYVLGMVIPLFIIASFLDKINFAKFMTVRKPLEFSLFARKIHITIADLISGITFFAMGIVIVYLAVTKQLTVHGKYQIIVNTYLTKVLDAIQGFVKLLPEYAWAILIIGLLLFIIRSSYKQFQKEQHEPR